MEYKTQVNAEDGKQDLYVIREFELPVELLFRAFTEADLIEQWMGTKVEKLESKKGGSYEYVSTDPKGNKWTFRGAIHDVVPNSKIIRTFEMVGSDLGVQMEVSVFEPIAADKCRLVMHSIYESIELREAALKLPFKQGVNWAHQRLEDVMKNLKR